jgi:hypothetical protein
LHEIGIGGFAKLVYFVLSFPVLLVEFEEELVAVDDGVFIGPLVDEGHGGVLCDFEIGGVSGEVLAVEVGLVGVLEVLEQLMLDGVGV